MPDRNREPLTPSVAPYLYEVLWNIATSGPLRASEIADDHNRPVSVPDWQKWTAQGAALRLRPLQKLGIVHRDDDGFWLLTEAGRSWLRLPEAFVA